MVNRSLSQLLDRLAAAEQAFLNQEFMAPAVRGGVVHVRIAGVVMRMHIDPPNFEGWGVFLPITHDGAMLVREATLQERRRYLMVTKQASLILCERNPGAWHAVTARGTCTAQLASTVQVRLVDGADLFDTVHAGFDGANFWFDRIDPRANSSTAAWLRASLAESVEPTKLQRHGLTAQQRACYALQYAARIQTEQRVQRDRIEEQLRESLQHAGAKLEGYVEHKDGFRVSYIAGGRRRVSSVNKDDLTVQVAGICLNGEDRKFDLTSLIGVLNESNARHAAVVGINGISEEDYWEIHPPQ